MTRNLFANATLWPQVQTHLHQPSFTQTEWATEDGKYHRTGLPYQSSWVLSLVRSSMLTPLPSAKEIDETVPKRHDESLGQTKLAGISLTKAMRGTLQSAPFRLFPTYCFSWDMHVLRLSIRTQISLSFNLGS